ncbi:MAG: 50S ribosomal protein L3 [Planctomycetes bacterium]|nr:50S ribosomal protein L3 [Planctomycetota bacterium]
MTIGILGKKLGMTQLFQPDGTWVPVTVVQAGPCRVLQVKAATAAELPEEHRKASTNRGKKGGRDERPRRDDGYYALQLGFDEKREKAATKAELGHLAKTESTPKRFVRELRFDAMPEAKEGDDLTVAIFEDVARVDVTGTSKGRGWAGTIKRHGFQRQRMSHGNSRAHRRPGGLGRTYSTMKGLPKGKKMAGHYGVDRITVQNLEVVKIDAERNLMFLRGAVPGHRDGYLILRKSVKRRSVHAKK